MLEVREWLLGGEVWKARKERIQKRLAAESGLQDTFDPEHNEDHKRLLTEALSSYEKKAFSSYFLGLARKGFFESGVFEDLKGPFQKLQAQTMRRLRLAIEEIISRFESIPYKRGEELLKETMELPTRIRSILGILLRILNVRNSLEYKLLRQAFGLEEKRQIINDLVKNNCPPHEIAKKQIAMAECLQKLLRRIPYQEDTATIKDMLEKKIANCAGFSILACLLEDLRLKVFRGSVHGHAIVILADAANNIYWYDPLAQHIIPLTANEVSDYYTEQRVMLNQQLTEEQKTIEISKIRKQVWEKLQAFIANPDDQGVLVRIIPGNIFKSQPLAIFKFEIGNKVDILTAIALGLHEDLEHKSDEMSEEQKMDIRKQIIALLEMAVRTEPVDWVVYYNLGTAYYLAQDYILP